MTAGSIFREAGQALRFNRQRSILTTISLAWGVACFVILYSYGDGFHLALREGLPARGTGSGADVRRPDLHAGGRRARRPQDPPGAHRRGCHPRSGARWRRPSRPEMMMGGMTVVRGYRTPDHDGARRSTPSYGRIRNQTMASRPLARRRKTNRKSSAWRCWAARPPTSCSARSRPTAKTSPSTGCTSPSLAC